MVNVIHKFIHEYDFPYHDYLKIYKEELISNYLRQKEFDKSITDLQLPMSHPLNIFLPSKLNKIVKKNYWTGKPLTNYGFRIYIQNNINNTSFYHNHINEYQTSSISGVFYTDPPKDGGEISFLVNPDNHPDSPKEIIIKPKQNKLYLFPYWIFHKPLPQKDEEYRICFNWVHGSPTRPIHKLETITW